MRTIQIGNIVQVLGLQVKVLDREGTYVLGQVTEPYRNEKYLDLARIGHSADADAETLTLLGANVHIEGIDPAGVATRLPEAEVRAKFAKIRADLVGQREAKEKTERAAAEQLKAAELKTAKLADANQVQQNARAELKQLITTAGDVKKLADSSKLHKLLMRVASAEQIIGVLNNKHQ